MKKVTLFATSSRFPVLAAALLGLAMPVFAQEQVTREEFPVPKRNYSPYVDQNFSNRVFWGDTHLHTSYSTDAGRIGCRLGPDEAYRFARGEEVMSNTGQRARLSRPLDFLVVSDHAENLGLAPMIATSDPILLKTEVGKLWHDMVKAGKGFEAFGDWIRRGSTTGKDPINSPEMMRTAWEYIVRAAEKYNEPGKFTAFGLMWMTETMGKKPFSLGASGRRAQGVLYRGGRATDCGHCRGRCQGSRAHADRREGRRAMKTVDITKASLANYGRTTRGETWVLTRRGRPVAAVVPIRSGVDLEAFGLSHNPEFIRILNRSWRGYKKTGGISLEELRKSYGLETKTSPKRLSRQR
ncbi:MAG: DUF3604 domain-containing protein [Thermoanaerobaculia bacterium]